MSDKPDVTLELLGQRFTGREEIRDALDERFALVPDIQWVDGVNWIAGYRAPSEWRVRGTASSGARVDCLGCGVWTFRDGKIVKKDTYYKNVTK